MKLTLLSLAVFSVFAQAQSTEQITITGTRVASDVLTQAMAIDRVDGEQLREGQLGINLSEGLQRVPGLNMQNRSNYAQDLQISMRGFGARASFGVRGVRLFADGIPATQPDGQGQVAHFALGSAERVEVLRGPFSVLYGNAAGGVINILTEDAKAKGELGFNVLSGGDGLLKYGMKASGMAGDLGITAEAGHVDSNGFRPQSAFARNNVNIKASFKNKDTQATFIFNNLALTKAQDPLGLTRAEYDLNPLSTTPTATQFNTRKDIDQNQAGVKLAHSLKRTLALEATLYYGERAVTQFQSIPVATQTPITQPGGVIDFSRAYYGVDLRAVHQHPFGNVVVGVNIDKLNELRQGYQNFTGTGTTQVLGVIGALRRNERNTLGNQDIYAQGEVRLAEPLKFTAGVRVSEVKLRSQDYFIQGTNPDDSGSVTYRSTSPVLGINYRASQGLAFYASAGRGFETPTFNELSYRAGGATGLNFDLKPAVSDSVEIGAKYRSGTGIQAQVSVFQTKTNNEIATLTNSGGRSSFQNVGKSERKGLEAALSAALPGDVALTLSGTYLNANYQSEFKTCGAPPCTIPSVLVAAGNLLPGIPKLSGFAELAWRPVMGLTLAVDAKHQSKIYVNDTNTDAAKAYTLLNARLVYEWQMGSYKLSSFVRGDNLSDQRYSGTVIVNEGNSRFFEPGAPRRVSVGLGLSKSI